MQPEPEASILPSMSMHEAAVKARGRERVCLESMAMLHMQMLVHETPPRPLVVNHMSWCSSTVDVALLLRTLDETPHSEGPNVAGYMKLCHAIRAP